MNSKLHAVADAQLALIRFFMMTGPIRDPTGYAIFPGSLPKKESPPADRG
jgi:hypothetical protein